MKQYDVKGMSCAACSARVEKVVSKVSGVSSCTVSLLTNSMSVDGTAAEQEIIAVQVSDANEARAFRSAGLRVDSQKNYDLSSRALTDQLRPCWRWEAGKSYRLTGKVIKGKDIVVFDFNTSICVSPLEEPEGIIPEQYGAQNEIPLPTHH